MLDLEDGVFMDQVEELVEGKRWAQLRDMLLLLEPADIALILDKLPEDRLPEVSYAPIWETLDLSDIDSQVAGLPYWGGYW